MRNKLNLFSKKKKSFLTLTLIFALITMVFLPIQMGSATPTSDTPISVDGRILPANLAGDKSDWIEIAQYTGLDGISYSLIVRANYINIYGNGHYNEPTWQYCDYSYPLSNNYLSNGNNVYKHINNWFNNRASGSHADNLPATARLRDYTVQNNAKNVLGTSSNAPALTDGFSLPYSVKASTGNDIAFALSYSEAAKFISIKHDVRGKNPQMQPSSPFAISNYGKINIPKLDYYGLWLRSPGDISTTAGVLDYTGRVFQFQMSGSPREHALVYPAVWVSSDVFDPAPSSYTISYVLNGGVNAVGNPVSYSVSSLPLGIASPSRSGYAFSYWSATCANGSVVTLPSYGIPVGTTGNITLSAVWSVVQYDISYVLSTGTNAPGNPVSYNVESAHLLGFADPVLKGYRFLNWMVRCANGTMFELTAAGVPAGTYGDLVVVAVWDPTPVLYSISYVLDGGVNAAGNPVEYAVTSLFPVDIGNPSRAGYSFLGWIVVYSNGTVSSMVSSYSIPAGSACDVTLNAYWLPVVQSYSIGYVLDVGVVNAVGNPVSYATSSLPVSVAAPSRVGFVFSHWVMSCANGSVVVLQNGVIPAGTTGDVVLSAVWTVVPVYSIMYVLGGGVNAAGNPDFYSVESVFPISIADPTLAGRTFLYWVAIYADGSLSVLPPTGIAAGTTGNLTLIAVWYP
jgi:hypothetical protein